LNAADEASGKAVVNVQLLETTATGTQLTWAGTWSLVLGSSGWLLDNPDFGPSSQLAQSGNLGSKAHGPGTDGSNPGPGGGNDQGGNGQGGDGNGD
jgi:hypothetical protein